MATTKDQVGLLFLLSGSAGTRIVTLELLTIDPYVSTFYRSRHQPQPEHYLPYSTLQRYSQYLQEYNWSNLNFRTSVAGLFL